MVTELVLVPAIARLVAADEDTVRDVIHAFDQKGLAGATPTPVTPTCWPPSAGNEPAPPPARPCWVEGFVDWLELVKGGVGGHAIAEYADHLRRPGHLRASYEYFRAFPRDVEDTIRKRGTTLAMPVLAIGGQGALG